MADDKSKTGKQDDRLVDINDPSEVEYLHKQYPDKKHSQVIDAIKVAGPERSKIVRYLDGKA